MPKKKIHIGFKDEERLIRTFNPHWFMLVIPMITVLVLFLVSISFYFIPAIPELDRFIISFFFLGLTVYVFMLSIIIRAYNVYQFTTVKIFNGRIVFPSRIIKREVLLDLAKTIDSDKPGIPSQMFDFAHIRIGTDSMQRESVYVIRYAPDSQFLLHELNKRSS